MLKASLLTREKERLSALQDYTILDTVQEAAYDRIVLLAAKIFDVPSAYISFVDETRQWLKARCGVNLRQTARSHSFCTHTIESDEILVVNDTRRDPRFAGNPFVTGRPFVRFYAGAPLITPEGHRLGSLCLLDHRPRRLTAEKVRTLRYLADLVMDEMSLRKIKARDQQLATIVEDADAGATLIDSVVAHAPITYANQAFLTITGYDRDEVVGRPFYLLFGPGTNEAQVHELQGAIAGGVPFRGTMLCHRKDRSRFWNELVLRPMFGESGEVCGYSATHSDVTPRLQLEEAAHRDRLRLLGFAANVPGMVFEWLTYRDGTPRSVPFVSEGCWEMFGMDPAAIQTEPDFLLHRIPAPDRPGFAQSIADAAASLRPWRWQGRVLLPGSEEERWLQGSAQPQRLPGGDLIWECLLMDVTRQLPFWPDATQGLNGDSHGMN